MSHLSPITIAGNWNKDLEIAGAALCALGDILQATDFERLECECTQNGLGYLLNIVGSSILVATHNVQTALADAAAPPPA
ncbi:MAG: hypothetical protein NDI91_01970 [Sulfuritalea sp.]|nr:hypothetical protein [Sulfuritalea sp.]